MRTDRELDGMKDLSRYEADQRAGTDTSLEKA